ncbi:ABC transporter ATP-binding protein [Myxococcus stipitatus]|uniref:ABC transporter ATP-binding protein n=1 Tax=Myxococcus stipitatus TaxID=83455 RepID=UPI001F1C8C28|nr:ABC transporter ATP-binding protein [Myxococcus stipitatus]MCE9669683.1 ABC transporter ATP-binding protein [Myxococcus stipitatus]
MLDDTLEVLRVEGLGKVLGPAFRLEGIGFRLERGQGLALIGPNGAGKSTLLRILAGLTRPDSGEVVVRGTSSGRWLNKLGTRVGFVQQFKGLPDDLTVGDYVRHQLRMRRVGAERYEDLLRLAGLAPYEDQPATRLSGGNQRKIHIVCAIAHAPDLLVLDEPTSGLDAPTRETLLAFIRELKGRGMSLVVATHHLEEVRALAEHALVLRDGRQVALAHVEALVSSRADAHCLELRLQDPDSDAARVQEALHAEATQGDFVLRVDRGAERVRLYCADDGGDPLPRAVAMLARHRIRLNSVRRYEPTLAEIVAELTRTPHTPEVGPKERI